MPKPVIEFRSPKAEPKPEDIEKFLHGVESTPVATVAASPEPQPIRPAGEPAIPNAEGPTYELMPRRRAVVARKDGRAVGRLTVYVPNTLSLRLGTYAAHSNRSMSELVTEALEHFLSQAELHSSRSTS